jgi:RNA polymerase sigma factor (sigma-70 family)
VTRYPGRLSRQLNRIFDHGTATGLTEGMLLNRFIAHRDEAAFAALVARHGPMVLGVCRRILADEHEVEDAFQATFLVLVRRAPAIRDGELVGNWLHGVAHRVAVRARAQSAYRRAHLSSGLDSVVNGVAIQVDDTNERDLRAILDEELKRLPGSLRFPIILCYLEGCTHDEAAAKLKWPVGTVRSRMARARTMLRRRLARHGLAADGSALSAALARQTLTVTFVDSTVHASLAFVSNSTPTGRASVAAIALAQGVFHTMTISKIKTLAALALTGALALGGARTLARQFAAPVAIPQAVPAASQASDDQAALLRAVNNIDDLFDDVDRRSRVVQSALRSLRKQIASLPPKVPQLATNPAVTVENGRFRETSKQPASATAAAIGQADPASTPAASGHEKVTDTSGDSSSIGVEYQSPSHFRVGPNIIVVSPTGNKVAFYHTDRERSHAVRLSDGQGTKHTVVPLIDDNIVIVALRITGKDIRRIAVATTLAGRWFAQDLREPAEIASPVVAGGFAYYVMGRYVYAFSTLLPEPRWDVLELPPGSVPRPSSDSFGIRVDHGSHLYRFTKKGKWDDIDANAILDAP